MQASLSKQNLIHYYPNKPMLYEAVIEYVFEPILEIDNLLYSVDPADFKSIERWIDILAERPSIVRLIVFGAVLPEDSDIPPVFKEVSLSSFKTFEAAFKRIAPKASKADFYHFACALSGTTLFYAGLLGQRAETTSQKEKSQAIANHKELVLLNVKSLLEAMQYR